MSSAWPPKALVLRLTTELRHVPLSSSKNTPLSVQQKGQVHFRLWHKADQPIALADVRFRGAGSTGRRNTGVESLCWCFKLQGLTRPFVELTRHFVQMGLRVHRQVGALREVLSQQAIGVLVRPALPRALRMRSGLRFMIRAASSRDFEALASSIT